MNQSFMLKLARLPDLRSYLLYIKSLLQETVNPAAMLSLSA